MMPPCQMCKAYLDTSLHSMGIRIRLMMSSNGDLKGGCAHQSSVDALPSTGKILCFESHEMVP